MILVVIVGVLFYFMFSMNDSREKERDNQYRELKQRYDLLNGKLKKKNKQLEERNMNSLATNFDEDSVTIRENPEKTYIKEYYDRKLVQLARVNDIFVPPTRSLALHTIPTRGYYGPFEQVGMATNDKDTFMLMGRKIHSTEMEYYTVNPNNGMKHEISRKTKYDLYDGDTIVIKGIPGNFTVRLYESELKYIPDRIY